MNKSEYIIYSFPPSEIGAQDASHWKRVGTLQERSGALKKAQQLLRSGQCGKIEIKQRYFCVKRGCAVEAPFKVLRLPGAKKKALPAGVSAFILAVLCGLAALSVAYVLGTI